MKQKNKLPKQKTRSVYSFSQVKGDQCSALSPTDTDPTSPATLTTTHLK